VTDEIEPAPDVESGPADAPQTETLPPSQLTAKERQIGLVLAGLAAVSGVAQWLPDAIGKSDTHALALAAVSFGLAIVFGLAVWNGRRLIAAFGAVLAGLPTPHFVVGTALNALMLAYGAYLMIRYSNAAGKRAAEQRQAKGAARRAGRGARTKDAAPPAGSTKTAAPSANKRYTPPKKTTKRR